MVGDGQPRRIAIIGTGLAGLATAHFLQKANESSSMTVEVYLFERNGSLGMDSESVTVDVNGESRRVDVPMRAFSKGYYPELVELYQGLGIPFASSSFSFAFGHSPVSQDRIPGPIPEFMYSGLEAIKSSHIRFQQPQRSRFGAFCFLLSTLWSYLVMIVAARYYVAFGCTANPNHKISKMTFGDWLASSWISQSFAETLLIPLFSSIMTADPTVVKSMPAAETLQYINSTFLYNHFTVQGGVSQVVRALTNDIPESHIKLQCMITDLVPVMQKNGQQQITIQYMTHSSAQSDEISFDHIVFAAQGTQTARLLQMYERHLTSLPSSPALTPQLAHCREQIAHLKRLAYEQSTVVCHTDTSVLSPNKTQWQALNLVSPLNPKGTDPTYTMATHIVGRFEDMVIMQTTNPLPWLFPEESKCISQSTFERFVLTLEGRKARELFFDRDATKSRQPMLGALQGPPGQGHNGVCKSPGIWFCGSWSYGVPLLEGCVTSARLVTDRILALESAEGRQHSAIVM